MAISNFPTNGLDIPVIYWIHQVLHNTVLDELMPYIRMPLVWIPLYLFIIYLFIRWFGKKFWIPLLFLAAAVGFSDYSNSSIIKKLAQRPRPCNEVEVRAHLDVLVPCGSGYSFMSSHAANHMAIGYFMYLIMRRKKNKWAAIWLLWAAIIGFAQVYVGVHYPIDALSGAVYGALIGGGFYCLYRKSEKRIAHTRLQKYQIRV
ncbi:MAG TPA: phosphatase PAP2 family protein [Saprospiraceae bacterium]|nr:phosphatase PAP2 family protein [Saprospiraceae bacterium]HQW55218.1 phosphatase PAP2 family protein [Saprospiraceae bacterium]